LQVAQLKAMAATREELDAVRGSLGRKADKALLDQVSGGSTSAITTLEESLAELSAAHAALEDAVQRHASTDALHALEQKVATQAEQADLQALSVGFTTSLGIVQASLKDVDAVKSKLAELQVSCSSREGLAALEAALAGKADKAELDRVSGGNAGALTEMQASLVSLQAQASEFATAGVVTGVEARLTAALEAAKQEVDAVTRSLQRKAEAKDVEAIAGDISSLKRLQDQVRQLQEQSFAAASSDKLAELDQRLAGKCDFAPVQALSAAVEAMKKSLKNMTGSEQMAEVQQRLGALTEELARLAQAFASTGSTMEGITTKVAALESALQDAAQSEELATLKVRKTYCTLVHAAWKLSRHDVPTAARRLHVAHTQ
jgi:hypothetical protein